MKAFRLTLIGAMILTPIGSSLHAAGQFGWAKLGASPARFHIEEATIDAV
jgi:hypothetical protein